MFSNVARANSTLGRALQLMLANLGGARPHEIDMSTLGNPGKFSYCIAENEEESPWPPLAADRGLPSGSSAVTLFAGEPPHGVSEHTARTAPALARALSAALATAWSYRSCVGREALRRPVPRACEDDRSATAGARTTCGSISSSTPACRYGPIASPTAAKARSRSSGYAEILDRRRAVLPEVSRAVVHPPRRRRRHGGQVLGGDRRLVRRPARQSDGDVSGLKMVKVKSATETRTEEMPGILRASVACT